MAVYNEIGIGRWNRFIQKLCDMKGGPPARQLSSEINFSHSIFHGAENRYLEQWDRFANGNIVPTGGAGAFGVQRYRNPAGSNIIAVIEKLLIVCGTAATADTFFIDAGATNVDVANIFAYGTGIRLDPRGRANPTLILSTQNAGAAPALGTTRAVGAASGQTNLWDYIFTDNQEFPLLPGDAFQVRNNTANVTNQVSIVWRERFLEPAERF